MSEIAIAPLTDDRVAGFRACLDVVARERRYLGMIEAPPLAQLSAWAETQRAGGAVQLLALRRDEVVGWCDITPGALPGFTHAGTLGLGVLPSWRGRGIGRRLLQAALDRAEAAGLERIELQVYAGNAAALRLYERAGFRVEGRKRRGRKLDGRYDDVVLMALLIDEARERRAGVEAGPIDGEDR